MFLIVFFYMAVHVAPNMGYKALASDALQSYCNAILRNCNAIFYFKITLFYVFDYAVLLDHNWALRYLRRFT